MRKVLSTKIFILSQVLILLVSLTFLSLLYYILNFYNQTQKLSSLQAGPVTRPPNTLTLELTSPEENLLTFDPKILISGKTAPHSQIIISGNIKDWVTQSKSDGRFSADFDLIEGVNEITIIVFDKTGDQRTRSKTVYYSKEKI